MDRWTVVLFGCWAGVVDALVRWWVVGVVLSVAVHTWQASLSLREK